MTLACTRCEATGFINFDQTGDSPVGFGFVTALIAAYEESDSEEANKVLNEWQSREDHDVQVCDCCGDGGEWYGEPGQHYSSDDPQGKDGPYGSNGELSRCH